MERIGTGRPIERQIGFCRVETEADAIKPD
jgi:hypothetical protein